MMSVAVMEKDEKKTSIANSVEEHTTTNLNAPSMWPFIVGQAELHEVKISGSLAVFKEHLKLDKQRVERSPDSVRLLNCRIYTYQDEESGFALFNPAFDSEGNFGFYMEDVYVAQDARGKGLGKVIWQKISQRALLENATFIKWVTDGRNHRMMDFAENKLMAKKPDEENLDGTPLLTTKVEQEYLDRYDTKMITIYDAADLKQLGIKKPEELAQKSHRRLPLVGFITREKNSPNTVVSATIAYLNYSTFKTCWGINVESPIFRHGVDADEKKGILHSTIKALQSFKISPTEFNEYANGSTPPAPEIHYVKWHAAKGAEETSILKKEFGLQADKMSSEDQRSTLILYIMPHPSIQTVSGLNL